MGIGENVGENVAENTGTSGLVIQSSAGGGGGTSTTPTSQMHSWFRSFGLDYIRIDDSASAVTAFTWAGSRHDWIVGSKGVWPNTAGFDFFDVDTYNTVTSVNPNAGFQKYVPYHSIFYGAMASFIENWFTSHSLDPEDAYMHYYYDTDVRVNTSQVINVKGWGGGTSPQRTDSRVVCRWATTQTGSTTASSTNTIIYGTGNFISDGFKPGLTIDAVSGGTTLFTSTIVSIDSATQMTVSDVGSSWASRSYSSRVPRSTINPLSANFRLAYIDWLKQVITVPGQPIYAHSLFLDSYDGLADDFDVTTANWDSFLENTVDYLNWYTGQGGSLVDPHTTIKTAVYGQVRSDMVSMNDDIITALKAYTGNSGFFTVANAAELDFVFNRFTNLYGTYISSLPHLCIEYFIDTATGYSGGNGRIGRMVEAYTEMEAGTRKYWLRAETTYRTNTSQYITYIAPSRYFGFMVAALYCMQHDNAYLFAHLGGAGNYGGTTYPDITATHWMEMLAVDIGTPITRATNDYWGTPNTNRFFQQTTWTNMIVIGREFTNALVIAAFPATGSYTTIGNNSASVSLGGTYYELATDGTRGAGITSLSLGNLEGAVLMKSP